jgi:hypothetical protein
MARCLAHLTTPSGHDSPKNLIYSSLDYPRSLGDINSNRVKIESADNRERLLPNYSQASH